MKRTAWMLLPLAFLWVACQRPYQHIPPAPPTAFFDGEARIQHGDFVGAINEFRTFLDRTDDPAFRPRAYYQLARAYCGAENYQACINTLDELEAEFPEEQWTQTSALRGDAQTALGFKTEAFLAWEEAWERGSDDDRDILKIRMEKAAVDLAPTDVGELNDLLVVDEVREILALNAPPPPVEPVPETTYAAVEMDETIDTPGDEFATGKTVDAAGGTIEEISDGATPVLDQSGIKVACLLPLTGPDKTYGARALSGLRIAFADSTIPLVVRDTGGDPDIAKRIVTELASNPSVIAVLGPLRSVEADTVGPQAEKLNIPLVLLSQKEGVSGEFVMQSSMTRPQQIRAIVSHATRNLNARRFGILYPEDNYGRTYAKLFRAEAARLGAHVVGTRGYPPGEPNLLGEVGTTQRWVSESRIDAVFIPDMAQTATMIASAVRRQSPDLVLLGTEGWNRPEAIAAAGASIDGAVFADAFFAGSENPETRSFVSRFEEYAGRAPTIFEAQAYDAGMLVRRSIDSGSDTRDRLLSSLKNSGPFSGAGRVVATRTGFEREIFLLRAANGQIQEVVPPSSSRAVELPG